jgi:hypothetical protein
VRLSIHTKDQVEKSMRNKLQAIGLGISLAGTPLTLGGAFVRIMHRAEKGADYKNAITCVQSGGKKCTDAPMRIVLSEQTAQDGEEYGLISALAGGCVYAYGRRKTRTLG